MVRHPFDAIRSFYDYTNKLNFGSYLHKHYTIEEFTHKLIFGAIPPASWQEHVLSWYAMKDEYDMLFVRYEDIYNRVEKE